MTNIYDVARLAGVSATTVSHVLNGSRPVHLATKQRVLLAIDQLNYRPNMLARSLRRGQTRTIGLLVSDIQNPFFTELGHAVEQTAHKYGYTVILCNTDEDISKERLYVDTLLAKQVEGLIIAPAPGDHTFLKPYLDRGLKAVFVNRAITDVDAPSVISNDEEVMYALVGGLLARGHRRFGAVTGIGGISTTDARLAGLRRALDEFGIPFNSVWLFAGHARQEGGRDAAYALAEMAEPPTAVIAFNSLMLDGLLLGLLDRAPHLIGRIELTGFGCTTAARICRSADQIIIQPCGEIGRTAVDLLLDGINGQQGWHSNQVVIASQIIQLGPAIGYNGALAWKTRYRTEGLTIDSKSRAE